MALAKQLAPAPLNPMLARAIFIPSGRAPLELRYQHCTGGPGGDTPYHRPDQANAQTPKFRAIFIPSTVLAGLVDGGGKAEYMAPIPWTVWTVRGPSRGPFRGPLYFHRFSPVDRKFIFKIKIF